MRSVEAHARVVADLIGPRPAAIVGLADAAGLVLADDVVAPLSLPGFDNSAMDGYAVIADDVASATAESPVTLPVAEDIPAGRTDTLTLKPGTAHRIMTGAPVPAGATAVVPVEVTNGGSRGGDISSGTESVKIFAAAKPGQHIRWAGEDVTAGVTVLSDGQVVTPAALGLAAALGLTELTVIPRQRVLVVSTGEELVPAGQPLRPGQIYESNAVMLAAAVREAGGEVVAAPMTGDDVDEFRHALDTYASLADLIITTGGVSAGAYEVVKDSLRGAGIEFVKVAMQPGMPQGAGRLEINGVAAAATSYESGTSIVCLPGNPVSALVSFEVFVRPALRTAMALPSPHRPRRMAVLTDALTSPRGKRQFRRGVLDHATASVTTYGPPASHHLRWLASANCLLEIGEDVEKMAAGSHVQVWDLSTGVPAVESAGWPDAPSSPEMMRIPKPPG